MHPDRRADPTGIEPAILVWFKELASANEVVLVTILGRWNFYKMAMHNENKPNGQAEHPTQPLRRNI